MMRATSRRSGLIALCLTVMLGMVGCSALVPTTAPSSQPDTTQAQNLDAACAIVDSEWGWAMEPWLELRELSSQQEAMQKKVEHQAMIGKLQVIAERVEEPEVRQVLDTTISIHQKFADDLWPALRDIPQGYVLDLKDPSNRLVILGQKLTDYKQQLSDADVQRYDLCGAVQNGQTGDQACTIVNNDWVDAKVEFNSAVVATSNGKLADGTLRGEAALKKLKATLVQVTVTDVLQPLSTMYDAYQAFYDDQIVAALTDEQLEQLSADELTDVIEQAEKSSAEWDGALRAGESTLRSYCNNLD